MKTLVNNKYAHKSILLSQNELLKMAINGQKLNYSMDRITRKSQCLLGCIFQLPDNEDWISSLQRNKLKNKGGLGDEARCDIR